MNQCIGTCLLLTLYFTTLSGQAGLTEHITIEHGLSQGMIFDIVQTRDGFLWIATKDGLNRYDGYNFRIFSNDPFDPYSLRENTITTLFEDSRGLLWAGTESKGLNVYDRKTGLFHHFPLNFGRNIKSASFEVYSIFEAPDGSIYLLQSGNGLVRIAIPESWKEQLPPDPDLSSKADITLFALEQFRAPGETSELILTAIRAQPDGAVWVYSALSPYLVEPDKGFVRPVVGASNGTKEDVWGVAPGKLIHFRRGELQKNQFSPGTKLARATTKPTREGGFWVSANHQLWHLEPGEALDIEKPDWELDARITAMTKDRNGNIWVGTQGYGLRKINPRKQLFHSGAPGNSIWGLWRDLQGRYFCKLVNEVYSYDPANDKLETQRAFGGSPWRVLDMCIDKSGAYWLLGRAEAEEGITEIRRHDPVSGLSKSFPFPDYSPEGKKPKPFKLYTYARLLQAQDGRLWATGVNCLLARLDPTSGKFDYFDYSSVFKEKAETVRALAFAEDKNGLLWIGTQQGLVKCVPRGASYDFELMEALPGKFEGLNNNSIACLLPDPEEPAGVLWIGTKGGGINRLDIRNNRVEHFTIQNGLPDNVVYGILPGNKGELWCSTNRGLARIRLSAAREVVGITTFTAVQGLQDNEFNTQAFSRAANGELLFGGVNGLNHFFPEEVLPDTTPPPVFLVGLRINHQPAVFGKPDSPVSVPLGSLTQLRLSHYQNNLSFEFAVLDFTDPAKNRYRYRLVGADSDWVETGTHRYAHFTHLAPGRYTLLAQGNNGEGNWQDIANPIAITILPPWWRSAGAYLVYAGLLIWGVWEAYRFQVRRVKIREQLAYEHRETARVKAMEEMKTNFFNNITHEFRTPLSLILEPARRIRVQSQDPEISANARRIETNSLRLLDMVNQLLDLAKLESGSMGLDMRRGDFTSAIREVFHSFLPLADHRGVKLSFSVTGQWNNFVFDTKKIELIINNLISNALKFTPAEGEVKIRIAPAEKDPGVEVIVSDTGIGIPDDALGKIFDRFYQVNSSQTRVAEGSGIGLALSRELAELLGGSLTAQSKEGKGSTFILRLPVLEGIEAPLENTDGNMQQEPDHLHVARSTDNEQSLALIIEDNAELREFMRQCLVGHWRVVEASNGEEGIRKAQELIPDMVISDVMMPVKDGYAVCDELKNNELTAHIPVILLTAKSTTEARIKGLRTGADDYLTKPFNTEELMARMDNLVELRRRLRQKFGQWTPNQEHTPDGSVHLSTADREFLSRFIALVEQHLADENMSVEDLAREMHISRVQLHRKLKALTDQNVTDYVRDYRLNRAMAMLRNREGLVYEIAYKVGFGSEKYFSRAFKEKFGVSPSQVM